MRYFVYILISTKCDKYYIGYSGELEKRIYEHNHKKGGKFSKTCSPWELVYKEGFASRGEALRREREIKSRKSRKYVEALIANQS
jgi:putative endonuclease